MPHLSRRQALSLIPGAGLLAAVAAAPARAAAIDHARLLANTVAIFAGTSDVNARPEVAGKLATIVSTARQRLTAMAQAGSGELFAGLALGTDDVNLRLAYQYLYEIALATRTPGSALDGDAAARQRVADGLRWLHERYFGDQAAGYYGNWHNWEIGIPTHVSRTLVLLPEELRGDLTATYIASMDAYLRNGKNGDVDLDSRFHTGANLADITANRILQGALTADDARVTKAVADQATVFATIDPYRLEHGNTDGYYRDGSFIQHHSVAYTGSYGRSLLTRVVQTLKMLEGVTSGGQDLPAVVQRWVTDGFAPLIFEGWMMEIVKGRAVSRTSSGYTDIGVVVEAIADLADHVEDALPLKKYLRFLPAADTAAFVSPVSIARYAAIRADASVPAADLNPPARCVAFNAMDRTVHRRPGYAFALARSSERISKYEYMSGENLMPWFQGDGAYYLYLAGEDQREVFGVDYYTAVSPYRLAGVTAPVEERRTVPELYGRLWYENPGHPLNFTSSSESQNTYVYFPRAGNAFSGGATLGAYGVAGMVQSDDAAYTAKQAGLLPDDFVAYRNARATKSWFMFDDEIVVLAAGVSGQGGRDVVTTVDSRIAAPGDAVALTGEQWDGRAWQPGAAVAPRWLRYANGTRGTAVGYAFLTRQPVSAGLETVTRSRRVVRTSNPDTSITKNVFTAAIGGDVPAFAYALVPNATERALRAYAGGPVSVLANDRHVQAVRHKGLGIVACNVFTDGPREVERLLVDGPAAVIVRSSGGRTTVALSDPTMKRERVSVVVRGPRLRTVTADEGVTVRRVPGGTLIRATTHQAYGRSFTATLD
ncbi:polysaccharide lyase, family 8 [[Actinomadura] parvosata subsp. kistnae]|uniref:Silent information regulator protein Sir2 n=1 Tax=[Actinomadura] parvosata subsp. kistnae TaxID=1909395 RepID=A0A1V0AE38_9ACTN|nr:polysaccharide lyase family 8 super-sandwich domain-containing protein [Nonomuraea sp. ATCC 55076]AQZ68491.1 silent information regulator protein Sir2 [Nonomuraea sp. ATCC 55076]SPL93052.1 polysaccharide lyase, family 8 [Actinomadura parvosata subsp. kistnae]